MKDKEIAEIKAEMQRLLKNDEEEQAQYMLERVMKNAMEGLEAYS